MKKPEIQKEVNYGRPLSTRSSELKPKMSREELARKIENMRARDEEMVTGVFKNLENPASAGSRGMLQFTYMAYPGQEYQDYELYDGERYTLPRGVARHLNNNCYYREYQHIKGEFGDSGMRQGAPDGKLSTKEMQASRKVHRYAFHSMDFMDDDPEMMPADIIEVTASP